MVYERDGKRWIFFHDLFGRWQWTLVDESGATVMHAASSFESFSACAKDARKRGFRLLGSRSRRSRRHTLPG